MENYTDILVNQGFDDVRLMLNQMNTGYTLTDENLKIFKEKNKDINYLIEVLNHLNNIQEIKRVFNQVFDITINSEKFYNKSENENISKIKELFKTEYYKNPEYSENIEKIFYKKYFCFTCKYINNKKLYLQKIKRNEFIN